MKIELALQDITADQAMAIFQALAQYVENGHCAFVEDPYAEDPLMGPAEAVLDKLNLAIAELAT